jgi:hypothetical protein
MKKLTTLTLIGASVLALGAGASAASAQPRSDWGYPGHWQNSQGVWMNINQRQAQLDRRIDQGLRRGDLSRAEAARLRNEFRMIARMEQRYRVNGLSVRERADLDRRFDQLAARIRWERNDRQYGYGYGDSYRR